ncbi:Plasmid stabilization system protein [Gimesia alba]|uniref:Plasmid stabilization system protein n=2 Tax=Gimesia alba TaxID=2527973 RepID=A0A517RI05_9PLAN|nr:Plasmid stabilization system protein [Gimesia alba]
MKYKVEITPSAENDVEQAYCYIRNDSPVNAVRWRKQFYKIAGTLSRFPEGCGFALENELVDFEVRQKLHGSYRILFTVDGNRVIVLHVRHCARRTMRPDDIDHPNRYP